MHSRLLVGGGARREKSAPRGISCAGEPARPPARLSRQATRSVARSLKMNFLRKSLARGSAPDDSSPSPDKGRTKSLRMSLGLVSRQASSTLSPSETRKSMRDSFDSDAMSLDDKLRARSRTSLRRCNNDFVREPVGW